MKTNRLKIKTYSISKFRIFVVFFFLLMVFGALVVRLYWIQIYEPGRLIKEGNSRVIRSYKYLPPRGIITDRFGQLLAISVPSKEVYADPKMLYETKFIFNADKIKELANILEIEPASLLNMLKDKRLREKRIKKYLPIDKAQALAELKIPGIYFKDTYMRYYPTGNANSNLIGILNAKDEGAFGIEDTFDTYLSSMESKRIGIKDLSGQVIENVKTLSEAKAGGTLVLSIDDRLQSLAYQVLADAVEQQQAAYGSAVMVDVKTGEILAMSTYPSFDPNNREVFNSENSSNRAVSATFEPGSTIKPIVALAALSQKAVNWSEVFDTRPFIVDGKTIRDSHHMNTGTLSDILKYSSNIGMAHIALRIGPEPILSILKSFGFGQRTSMALFGEVPGRINSDRKFWSQIDKATIGYGYGITVTALQLASAYATLANYGGKVPISILRNTQKVTPVQVANINDVKRLQQSLEDVVATGTGSKAGISRYRIAGKTGTAKIASVGGYSNKYISSFAGFAPMSDPKFALVVIINDPKKSYYGGVVSGPVFREIMTRALQMYNVPPDK